MRIRKHAKISPLIYAGAFLEPGVVLQTHICQLNQSPWDVMEFSPPQLPPQADADAIPARNGSSKDQFSAGNSNYIGQQSEYSDNFPANTAATVKAEKPLHPPPPPPADEKIKPGMITICSKTDGKNWKCKRETSSGNTMCDHHLSQVKSYSHTYNSASRKPKKPDPEARRLTRTKNSSSSNPNEFYYYSGFGPRWARKRGTDCKDATTSETANGSTANRNIEHRHEIEQQKNSPNDESDYDEFKNVEEEENMAKTRRKRGRKMIKARSLKSLM